MSAIEYSVVVPVHRGAETILELCERLVAFFVERNNSFEIILVDDGSTDGSWERITEIAESETRVVGVRLTRNFGQHNATVCGFRHARGEYIVTLDEDIQNPPEEIGKMIDCMASGGWDVVYGMPILRKYSWWRRFCSSMVMLVPRYVTKLDFGISGFRLIRAPIAREVAKSLRHDIILDMYLAWSTERISSVQVAHNEASGRKSSYSAFKLVTVLANLLCNYTVLPLRLAVAMGLVLSVLSMLTATYWVVLKLTRDIPVPGFATIAVSIWFSTGLILMGIGVMSEYLARIFLHINQKPQAIVRETTRNGEAD
ncbi:glycosyltransferase family 2 protein [Candidatus Hydrogenedentota bacterium]